MRLVDLQDPRTTGYATLKGSQSARGAADNSLVVAKNLTEQLCQRPVRDAESFSIASIVGIALAAVAYIMRLLSKVRFPCERGARIDTDFWWDDFTITVAMALLIPITALSNVCKWESGARVYSTDR